MKTYIDESKKLFWPQFSSSLVQIETNRFFFFALISQAAAHFLKCQSAFSLLKIK